MKLHRFKLFCMYKPFPLNNSVSFFTKDKFHGLNDSTKKNKISQNICSISIYEIDDNFLKEKVQYYPCIYYQPGKSYAYVTVPSCINLTHRYMLLAVKRVTNFVSKLNQWSSFTEIDGLELLDIDNGYWFFVAAVIVFIVVLFLF